MRTYLSFLPVLAAVAAACSTSMTTEDALRVASTDSLAPAAPPASPALAQVKYGTRGDFALLVPSSAGGLDEYVRSNDDASLPWRGPTPVSSGSLGHVDAASAVASNAALRNALFVVVRVGDQLAAITRDGAASLPWTSPVFFGAGAKGTPSVVQSHLGKNGNFEIAVPSATTGIDLYFRNNDTPDAPFDGPVHIADSLGAVDDVTLLASDYGANLELVARVGDALHTFWRDAGPAFAWTALPPIGRGAAGNPVLVQDASTTHGDFELLVPSVSGGLDHYARDNRAGAAIWSAADRVFPDAGPIDSVTMIRSNYGDAALDIVARAGDRLLYGWRDVAGFHGPYPLLTPPPPIGQLHKAYTEHLGKWTGTPLNDLTKVGMTGTDLGISFESHGKLNVLFGDSWSNDPSVKDDDSLATTDATSASAFTLPTLQWNAQNGHFSALKVNGIDLKSMNVPTDGISTAHGDYVFFDTGYVAGANGAYGKHSTSVLAHVTSTSPLTFALDHAVASQRFINVSAVSDGGFVYLFGSGAFRQSDVSLARVPVDALADRSRWSYFGGAGSNGPIYVAAESGAASLFPSGCIGELSVRKHPSLGIYLMTYNCDSPRGIFLRTSPSPEGPWSDAVAIVDPSDPADPTYGSFIHMPVAVAGFDDGLSESGREDVWGGAYGAYLVPRFFHDDAPGVHSIVYTVSSWNPYQAHLMRTVLVDDGIALPSAPVRGTGLPKATLVNGDFSRGLADWSHAGDAFALFTGADGKPRVTTFVPPKGDANKGRIWQDFTIDATTRELRFTVHGGRASVRLLRGDEVVRETRGPLANSPEKPVVWRLDDLRGSTVRLMIVDEDDRPWGFVGCSGFELR